MENKHQNTQKTVTPAMSTLERALKNAKEGKQFTLVRKVFKNERTGKYYYGYSVFGILEKLAGGKFFELRVRPYIGKTEKNDKSVSGKNSSGYANLNMLYDLSDGGLKLTLIDTSYKRDDGSKVDSYEYRAVAVDEDGNCSDVTRMVGENFVVDCQLLTFFSGFGRSRDFVNEDLEKIPGLKEAFENELGPGELPDVDVDEEAD